MLLVIEAYLFSKVQASRQTTFALLRFMDKSKPGHSLLCIRTSLVGKNTGHGQNCFKMIVLYEFYDRTGAGTKKGLPKAFVKKFRMDNVMGLHQIRKVCLNCLHNSKRLPFTSTWLLAVSV